MFKPSCMITSTDSSLGSYWRNGCLLVGLILLVGAAASWPRSQNQPVTRFIAPTAANQPAEPALPDTNEFLNSEMQVALAAEGLRARVRRTRIEDIEDDDFVLARDTETGKLEIRQVLKAFSKMTYHLRILEFADAAGKLQRIETTDEHPFWVVGRNDFVNACDLQVGEPVVGPNDEVQTLASTTREDHPEGVSVHNFEVEGLHNYFVQAPEGSGPYILTHNLKCADPTSVINSLRDFRSRTFRINGQTLLLDKKGLKHILERHHPRYWNGTRRAEQTFFDKNMSIEDVENAIAEVLKQNRKEIARIGLGIEQIEGVVNGQHYVLGLNRGRVGQFFPVP